MKAKLKMIFSMITFGTIAFFVKNIPLSTGEISLFRAIIGLIVISIYQLFRGNRIGISKIKRDLPILFLSGVVMGFQWVLLFQAYEYTTVSLATLSYYFAPVLLIILSAFILKERLTKKQIICFFMATLGLIMIIGVNSGDISNTSTLGILYGLGAAVLYATVLFLNKLIKNVTGTDRTVIQFIAAIIVLTPYVIATSGINILGINTSGLINLLILGAFHTGFVYCLFFSSVKDLKGQEAAILSYIDPLVSILVSVAVLKENMSSLQIIGGAMILGFTLINELSIDKIKSSNIDLETNIDS